MGAYAYLSMIKRLLKGILPFTARSFLGKKWHNIQTGPPILHRLFRKSKLPGFISFDEAFPSARKYHRRPAYTVPTPEAGKLLGKNDVTHLDRSEYLVPADFTSIVSDTLLCPNNEVVLTESNKIIRESSTAKRIKYFNTRPFFSPEQEALKGHGILLRSRFHNYYHLLIDALPRLLALTRTPFHEIESIKLLCPGGLTHTEKFFIEKLGLRNVVPISLKKGNFLYRVENLIFTPLKTEIGAGYLPSFYRKELQRRIRPSRRSTPHRRIFISREKARRRKLVNRDHLMEALSSLGFVKFVVEDLSHQEQINLFSSARVVIGAHGAGLTNLIFARQAKVVELFPYSWMPYPHYYYLCKSLEHPYRPVWGRSKEKGSYPHPEFFHVEIRDVLDSLDSLGVF